MEGVGERTRERRIRGWGERGGGRKERRQMSN